VSNPSNDPKQKSSAAAKSAAKKRDAPKGFRRVLRWLRNLSIFGLVSLVLLWTVIQTNPKAGPWLADAARAVVGPKAVAWAEDVAYSAQDRVNSWRYKDTAPKTFWESDAAGRAAGTTLQSGAASVTQDAGADAISTKPNSFMPTAVAPPFPRIATPSDGQWVAMDDDIVPTEPVMYKTLIHPDDKRPYAAVAVVAIDLRRVNLQMVAGTDEPASEVKRNERPGKVPEGDHDALVATFNGGWQAVHGHFGMMVNGVTFLPPKDRSCTIALLQPSSDGGGGSVGQDAGVADAGGSSAQASGPAPILIAPWTELASRKDIRSFRQTPPCLRVRGSHHELLQDTSRNWGAAVDGSTVIRRSAIGIDEKHQVLFYGVGDSLSALTIAAALGYAGAYDVAELDVNWAFPRFLTYSHEKKPPVVKATLIPAQYKPHEYVGTSWYRDFFYLTRKK
jgi:hypothetical protein